MQIETRIESPLRDHDCGTPHIQELLRLITNTGLLGCDPIRWRTHFLDGLAKCFNVSLSLMAEYDGAPPQNLMPIKVTAASQGRVELPQAPTQYTRFLHELLQEPPIADDFHKLRSQEPLIFTTRNLAVRTTRSLAEICTALELDRLRCAAVYVAKSDFLSQRVVLTIINLPPQAKDPPASCHLLMATAVQHICDLIGTKLADVHEPSPSAMPKRRRHVLEGVLQGKSDEEIAEHLGIAYDTVRSHLREVFRYFDVENRTQLMALWIKRLGSDRIDPQ